MSTWMKPMKKDEVTSASKSVLSINNQEIVAKVTRPQGRYKKREKGKLVEGYSSQDLEGILVNRAKSPQRNCNVLDEVKPIENHVPEPEPEIERKVLDVPPEWWGTKFGFIAGGLLGAESRRRNSPPTGGNENPDARATLNEDDQENLYKLVQDKSTSGKQGLVIKDRAKNVQRKLLAATFRGKRQILMTVMQRIHLIWILQLKGNMMKIQRLKWVLDSKEKNKKLCRRFLQQVPKESLKLKQLKKNTHLLHSPTFLQKRCLLT